MGLIKSAKKEGQIKAKGDESQIIIILPSSKALEAVSGLSVS
jgi:hypothetical protein